MKVFFCEKCNEILPNGNIECSNCGYVNENLYSKVQKSRTYKKIIIILAVIAAIVGFFAICNAAMLFPWQYQARQNRKAILEYARNTYPEAKIIKEFYPSTKFNPTNKPYDLIWFEFDGVDFYIAARDGKVNYDNDNYPEARTTAQFDKIIKDGFLKPRKINSSVIYNFEDDYRETYPYTGSLYIELHARGSSPQEVGWLYDFYKYWKTAGSFLKEYRVNILIYESDVKVRCAVVINNDSEFASEDEFYSAFEVYK